MGNEPIISVIDRLMAAKKTLAGTPVWREVGSNGEARLVIPLSIGEQISPAVLEVNAYPNIRDLRFRIMVRSEQCLCRVDFVFDEPHVNPVDVWQDCGRIFTEPHYHSWADNKRYATHSRLPDPLPVARVLPTAIRQFDAAFRWFCTDLNIDQPPTGMIELPLRSKLL